MIRSVFVCLVIAATTPLWCQVEPAATGGFDLDDTHMMTPPPVSSDAYPVVVGAETRANYVGGGVVFTGAYIDNLMLGQGKISDEAYYLAPSLSLDRRTATHGERFHYSPGFMIYQNTTELNAVAQDASAGYRWHLSPYAVIQVDEQFQQNLNAYNGSSPFAGKPISGAPAPSNTVVIAPFANQRQNSSSAGFNYQYAKNAMIGGTASYSFLHYSTDSKLQDGLSDGNNVGAIGFYSRRIAASEYIGAAYQFSKFITHPVDTYTLSHTVLGFYTHYFTRSFSLSVLAGPEHYASWSPTAVKRWSWTPAVQGSVGWQTFRTNLGASYSHIVSGAAGLNGTFHANMASMNGRLFLARRWTFGADAAYSSFTSINPGLLSVAHGGRTVGSGVDLQRNVTERLIAGIGYGHFHESYANVAAGSSPDSNRVYFSISYGFQRPLGR